MHLTNSLCEKAKPPARRGAAHSARFLWDDSPKGLGLRITDGARKTFVLQSRCSGRTLRTTVGAYPEMNLAQARAAAAELKSQYARGIDPGAQREAERQRELEAPTFGQLSDSYWEFAQARGRKAGAKERRRLEQHTGAWRERKAASITSRDVATLHAAVGRKHETHGGPVVANRVVQLINRVYHHAAKPGATMPYEGRNPARGLELFRERPRERYLSPDELHRVNQELLKERNPYARAFFPLAMMLGCRKNELLSARWSYVDLDAATLRVPMTKSGRSHLLPLPQPAIAILKALPSFARRGEGGWIFPGRGGRHCTSMDYAWWRVRTRAGVPDLRIHDLRHSLASWLVAAGFSLPLIGKVLGHSTPATTARYAHLGLEPQRAALDATATALFGAVAAPENLN